MNIQAFYKRWILSDISVLGYIYIYIYIYRSVSRKTHPVAPAVHIAHIARILEAEKEGKGRVPVSRSVYPSKRKNIG